MITMGIEEKHGDLRSGDISWETMTKRRVSEKVFMEMSKIMMKNRGNDEL